MNDSELDKSRTELVASGEMLDCAPNGTNYDGSPATAVPVGLGSDGEVMVVDFFKSPHWLVSGMPGSGKTTFLANTIIPTLISKNTSDELRLIIVDPQSDTYPEIRDSQYLLRPIIRSAEDCKDTFNWLVDEMERRYEKLVQQRVINVNQYKQAGHNDMPHTLVIIDNLEQLGMSKKKIFEDQAIRILQKSKAVGIFMVVATRRPSVDVVSGLMKANFATRISFKHKDQIDSRVALDQTGAEKLEKPGNFIIKRVETDLKPVVVRPLSSIDL